MCIPIHFIILLVYKCFYINNNTLEYKELLKAATTLDRDVRTEAF